MSRENGKRSRYRIKHKNNQVSVLLGNYTIEAAKSRARELDNEFPGVVLWHCEENGELKQIGFKD
jgi:hypothetical protein